MDLEGSLHVTVVRAAHLPPAAPPFKVWGKRFGGGVSPKVVKGWDV